METIEGLSREQLLEMVKLLKNELQQQPLELTQLKEEQDKIATLRLMYAPNRNSQMNYTSTNELVKLKPTIYGEGMLQINEAVSRDMLRQCDKEIPCYGVSFVGNSGVGKSTIASGLLKYLKSQKVPLQNPEVNATTPCSYNITAWPVFLSEKVKLMVFDYEGFFSDLTPQQSQNFIKNFFQDYWDGRSNANEKLFPPLCYATSDVIVHVSTSSFATQEHEKGIRTFIHQTLATISDRPALILIHNGRTSSDANSKEKEEDLSITLQEVEINLYKSYRPSFCYIKCISFPNYDSGSWHGTTLEPKGLLDYDKAINQLYRVILEGLNAVRNHKAMLFSEYLYIEIFGKVVEKATAQILCQKYLNSMFTTLAQYLTPQDDYVRAAYNIFLSLNSAATGDKVSHFKNVKACAIKTLALLLVKKLRKGGVHSSIPFEQGFSDTMKPKIDKLLNAPSIQQDTPNTTSTTSLPIDPSNNPYNIEMTEMKLWSSLSDEALWCMLDNTDNKHHPHAPLVVDLTDTKSGLLDLIGKHEPCAAKLVDQTANIHCDLTVKDHNTGWHKSLASFDGNYNEYSILWKLVVKAGSVLSLNIPTYWKGEFSSGYEDDDLAAFWQYYKIKALGEYSLHDLRLAALRLALREIGDEERQKLSNPRYEVTLPQFQKKVLCFLCAAEVDVADESAVLLAPFECKHKYCVECCVKPLNNCPVCGSAKKK